MKSRAKLTLLLACIFVYSLSGQLVFDFDFSNGAESFVGGVSDFGVNQSNQHQFVCDNQELPSPFPPGEHAQYVSGFNPSDDLFMYMKRKITGLETNTLYKATFTVEFASIYPTNAIGVGGPPGEGVTMKAGLTLIEPDTMIISKGGSFVAMNIDKGNQSNPGEDMDTIGHVGVGDTTTVYTLKTNDNAGQPFELLTDHRGEAWFIAGTDSGYESTTSIYYTKITVVFEKANAVGDPSDPSSIQAFPNPSSGTFQLSGEPNLVKSYRVIDAMGKPLCSQRFKGGEITVDLPSGLYFLEMITDAGPVCQKIILTQ